MNSITMEKNLKDVVNITWKAGVSLIGLLVLILLVRIGSRWCHYYVGRAEWRDKTLSANIVVRAYNSGKVRVYNKQTKRYTTPKLCWVAGTPKRDSLTVFCDRDGYRGFLNVNTGEIVIPAQYGKAWVFSEGLAAVEYDKKKLGFINHDNEMVIEDVPHESGFFDYVFKDGFCTVMIWDDKTDERIYSVYSSRTLGKVGEYHYINQLERSSYMIARSDEGYWLLDSVYERVFDEPYDYMEEVNAADGVFATRNYVKQYFDFDGTLLESFVIDGIERLNYATGLTDASSEYDQDVVLEFEPDLVAYRVNDNYGLMNSHTGKIITSAKYGDIYMISKDLLRAEVNYSNNESVLLDRNGKIVKQ